MHIGMGDLAHGMVEGDENAGPLHVTCALLTSTTWQTRLNARFLHIFPPLAQPLKRAPLTSQRICSAATDAINPI